MEFQTLNNKIKINHNKPIGKVLYIVEGNTREINIIANIFLNILEYEEVVSLNRNGRRKFRKFSSKSNPNSQIVIINSKSSNIKTIDNKEFIDEQIEILKEYGLEYEYRNSAIYYIFDGDRKEDKNNIMKLIENYNNSREPSKENEYDAIGGMLLLSYPAIETFIISNFEKELFKFNEKFDFSANNLKKYIDIQKYQDSRINEETIKNAFYQMIESLNEIYINKINLDDISNFNKKVYNYEIQNENRYMISLLLISLVDLGIIEMI